MRRNLKAMNANTRKERPCWVLVAQAYNPSYSGHRDQKDHSLRPAQAKSSSDPMLKKTITKKGWWSVSSGRMTA
jgi:hypothetical protein